MKKIKSLFKRNYDTDRLVRDEVVEGSEWVLRGDGLATVKYDGTACLVLDGRLYKRHDRKVIKSARKRGPPFTRDDFKGDPGNGWEACEDEPNSHTGHWPGWIPVGDEPESKWHLAAWENVGKCLPDGTYELIGPHFQANPYCLQSDRFVRHGETIIEQRQWCFDSVREFLRANAIEGIVWHRHDGEMVKIKRTDFGFDWP